MDTNVLQKTIPTEKLSDIKAALKRQDDECESELEVILTGRGENIPLRPLISPTGENVKAASENTNDHATAEIRNSLGIAQQPTSSRKSDLEIILAGLDQEMAEKLIESAAVLPYPEKGINRILFILNCYIEVFFILFLNFRSTDLL